jgi:hypothetical protein
MPFFSGNIAFSAHVKARSRFIVQVAQGAGNPLSGEVRQSDQ